MVSRLFPAWFLAKYPRSSIIAASCTTALAEDFGRSVRTLVAQYSDVLGYSLRPDSTAAGRWHTDRGGSYLAVGAGTAIVGRPGDLILIDDPISGIEAADSEVQRARLQAWYRNDVYSRLQPGAKIVIIQTRWREDDLCGWLLEQEKVAGDCWDVVSLPAFAGEDDPLGRKPGEALWREWMPEAALARVRNAIGEREFAALYQQQPRPAEGSIFRTAAISIFDILPAEPPAQAVRAWDIAASSGGDSRLA
ncbi:MAG: hypothetical protein JOY71_18245 [Acetobacteraceae bacterium]|nr:hypothetical protein [Acetobacteraceae bacterium]